MRWPAPGPEIAAMPVSTSSSTRPSSSVVSSSCLKIGFVSSYAVFMEKAMLTSFSFQGLSSSEQCFLDPGEQTSFSFQRLLSSEQDFLDPGEQASFSFRRLLSSEQGFLDPGNKLLFQSGVFGSNRRILHKKTSLKYPVISIDICTYWYYINI